jgi:CheY-like chemotaxis protein
VGVTFVLATSTEEAMDKVKRQSFDAIISDMGRPPDSRAGYTLLDKLRESGNRTPFIIYAGSDAPKDRAEARRRGAIGCTNRPDELFEMVLSTLGRKVSEKQV